MKKNDNLWIWIPLTLVIFLTAVLVVVALEQRDKPIVDTTYKEYFENNPKVKSLTIDAYNSETITYLWKFLNELEMNESINIEPPSKLSLCDENYIDCNFDYYDYTEEEKNKYVGAISSYHIWLDKNNIVSWDLEDYNLTDLYYIFDEDYIQKNILVSSSGVFDYNPIEDLNLIKGFIRNNQVETAYAMLDNFRWGYDGPLPIPKGSSDFRHSFMCYYGNGSMYIDPQGNTPYDYAMTSRYFLQPPYSGTCYESLSYRRIARHGCSSMFQIIALTMLNLNIPAYKDWGWYNGQTHTSAFIKGVGIVNHGDDIYTIGLNLLPHNEFLMPWDYFKQNVEPCGKLTECARNATITYASHLT